MKALVMIAALALSGCQFALPSLPTPADVCALSPAQRAALLEAMGSSEAAMTLACAVVR